MSLAETDNVPHVTVRDIPHSGVEVLGLEYQFSVLPPPSTGTSLGIVPEDTAAVSGYGVLPQKGLDAVLYGLGTLKPYLLEGFGRGRGCGTGRHGFSVKGARLN